MTKTQIWVAAFLGLFLVLFSISHFTGKDDEPKPGENVQENNASELSPMTLIKNNGCTSCHGPDLRGSNLGPTLLNLKQYWGSREELISYLRNPSSFMDKERFKNYKQKYSSVVMPPFSHIDIKELGKMTDYLLKL